MTCARTTAAETDARTLSQQPPVAWLAIADEARPDLRDARQVFDKFAAHAGEAACSPAEWERRWRLWLLREREPGAGTALPGVASPRWGGFLDPPGAGPASDPPPALSADYEVLRDDR